MPDEVRTGPRPTTAREVQALLQAERLGGPFLTYRDEAGRQVVVPLDADTGPVTVGRRPDSDIALTWDGEVSRVHAQLEAIGHEWALVDDGLSRNGSFVNGERVAGRRRLRDGDRMCFGETPVLFRAPGGEGFVATTAVVGDRRELLLSETHRRILVALCRPLGDSPYATPATNRQIAGELHMSVDAVKAHLRLLFARLGLEDLPQNQKRTRLAAIALVNGIVRRHEL
jgi:pSer/pThr/pTyr-binding forkhead associated (FHA) protein